MNTVARWVILSLTPVLLIGLSSCANSAESPNSQSLPNLAYAEEFARYAETEPNERVRAIYESGVITDADYKEIMNDFKQCIAKHGLSLVHVSANGGITTQGSPTSKPVEGMPVDECSLSTGFGSVSNLYQNMKHNPENIDTSVLTAECFVRQKVVEKGYSAQDYERDVLHRESGVFASRDRAVVEKIFACQEDFTAGK